MDWIEIGEAILKFTGCSATTTLIIAALYFLIKLLAELFKKWFSKKVDTDYDAKLDSIIKENDAKLEVLKANNEIELKKFKGM